VVKTYFKAHIKRGLKNTPFVTPGVEIKYIDHIFNPYLGFLMRPHPPLATRLRHNHGGGGGGPRFNACACNVSIYVLSILTLVQLNDLYMQRMDAQVAVTGLKPAMLHCPIARHDTNECWNSPAMDKTEPVLQP
jgi:hypothetical protein